MKKINNNLMVLSLKTLSILAFGLLIIPTTALATPGYVDNPVPDIAFISPDSSNIKTSTNMLITITGYGFVPSSVARVNGSDRKTTFVDYTHLFVRLNPSDISNADGFYLNVFNGFPGGGYSNSKYFTVNKPEPVANTNTGGNAYSNTSQTGGATNSAGSENNTSATDNGNSSNLAATAIFGSTGSFLPSGLIQWVVIAIIILVIIILVRINFGARRKYKESPMKHA